MWGSGHGFGNFRSRCAKGYYLMRKLEPFIERCICLNVLTINFFLHNLTYWGYEGFKDLVFHTQQKKCFAYVTLTFWSFHIFIQSKYGGQSIQANAPFQWRDQQSQMGFIRQCQGFGQNWAGRGNWFLFLYYFWALVPKFYFWRKQWVLESASIHFSDFSMKC